MERKPIFLEQHNLHPVEVARYELTCPTTLSMKYKDGVMIAADAGPTVDGEKPSNIYQLQKNIYTGVTGITAHVSAVLRLVKSNMIMLHRLTNYRMLSVRLASVHSRKLIRRVRRFCRVTMLIAGVDNCGTHSYTTRADGTSDTAPVSAIGIGTVRTLAELETGYYADIDEETARITMYNSVLIGAQQPMNTVAPVHLCVVRNDFSVNQETLRQNQPPPSDKSKSAPKKFQMMGEVVEMIKPRKPFPGLEDDENDVNLEE